MNHEALTQALYAVDPMTRENLGEACDRHIGRSTKNREIGWDGAYYDIEENGFCFFVVYWPPHVMDGKRTVVVHK